MQLERDLEARLQQIVGTGKPVDDLANKLVRLGLPFLETLRPLLKKPAPASSDAGAHHHDRDDVVDRLRKTKKFRMGADKSGGPSHYVRLEWVAGDGCLYLHHPKRSIVGAYVDASGTGPHGLASKLVSLVEPTQRRTEKNLPSWEGKDLSELLEAIEDGAL